METKCGILTQWNTIEPMTVLSFVTTYMKPGGCNPKWSKLDRDTVWSYSYMEPQKTDFIEVESKIVISRGWGSCRGEGRQTDEWIQSHNEIRTRNLLYSCSNVVLYISKC